MQWDIMQLVCIAGYCLNGTLTGTIAILVSIRNRTILQRKEDFENVGCLDVGEETEVLDQDACILP